MAYGPFFGGPRLHHHGLDKFLQGKPRTFQELLHGLNNVTGRLRCLHFTGLLDEYMAGIGGRYAAEGAGTGQSALYPERSSSCHDWAAPRCSATDILSTFFGIWENSLKALSIGCFHCNVNGGTKGSYWKYSSERLDSITSIDEGMSWCGCGRWPRCFPGTIKDDDSTWVSGKTCGCIASSIRAWAATKFS